MPMSKAIWIATIAFADALRWKSKPVFETIILLNQRRFGLVDAIASNSSNR